MKETKDIPGFVTAYEDSLGKIWIVAGHHRLAALMTFRGCKRLKDPFWIARAT